MLRDEFDIVDHRVKKVITLNDVWTKYLPHIQSVKKSWRDDMYYYGKHIRPVFGDMELSAITPLLIEKFKRSFKKHLNAKNKAFEPATIKHQLVILRRLFNIAIKWGMFEGVNPVSRVSLPKLDNEVVRFLDQQQVSELQRILDLWPNKQTANLIKFLLYTGCRRGEAFSLTWPDVDLDRGLITLAKPKGGRTITLPVNERALGVLKSVKRTESPYVFPGRGGERLTDISSWERIKKMAGLPEEFRLHDLRHHFGSSLVSNGVDIYTVSKLLSHKDVSTTRRYAHLSDEAMRAATEKAGSLFDQKAAEIIPLTAEK
jgi:integrase